MALSIAWGSTNIIYVPKSYLTQVSGSLYELDVNQFRQDLKELEDDVDGIVFPDTHNHNTEVTVAGITYARLVAILPPYSVEFEDGQYSVRLAGANNNIFDVEGGILVQNQVQVISTNSAGLINSGSIAQEIWDHLTANHQVPGSFGELVQQTHLSAQRAGETDN